MNKHAITIGTVSLALAGLLIATRLAESRMQTANQIIGETRMPISTLPYAINKRGSYYVTRNLTGSSGQSGITISADDVTIDLNGFSLKGVAGSLDGIRMTGTRSGIRIYGGTVSGWAAGIVGAMTTNSQLGRLNVTNNAGVGVKLADGNSVLGDDTISCITANGGNGVELGANGTMHATHVISNGGTEVVAGDGLSIYDVWIDSFGGTALTAGDTFEIHDSSLDGIVALGSYGSVQDSALRLEGSETIALDDYNNLSDCHIRRKNSSGSIAVAFGTGNRADGLIIELWNSPGYITVGSDNQITNSQVVGFGGVTPTFLIEITGARNVLSRNSIHAGLPAGSAAIKVSGGPANSIDSNTIFGDGVASITGIRLLTNDNVVVSNTFGMLMGAAIDDQGTGNLKGPLIDDVGLATATNPASQWRP